MDIRNSHRLHAGNHVMAAIPAQICSIPETSSVSFPRDDGYGLQVDNEAPVCILNIDPFLKQMPCEHALFQPPRVTPTPNLSRVSSFRSTPNLTRVHSFQSAGTAQLRSGMDPSFTANLICKLKTIREQDVVKQPQQQEDLNTSFKWNALFMCPQTNAGLQTFVSSWCCQEPCHCVDKTKEVPSKNDAELHPISFLTSRDEVKLTDEDEALCSKFGA